LHVRNQYKFRSKAEGVNFSALAGVKPMTETYPLEQAEEAFGRMMSGKARFRVVLTTGA
jgi:D-arabinose 1-dehydrogenase-like Zn-dependent alcohol dehydrogenase